MSCSLSEIVKATTGCTSPSGRPRWGIGENQAPTSVRQILFIDANKMTIEGKGAQHDHFPDIRKMVYVHFCTLERNETVTNCHQLKRRATNEKKFLQR